MKSGKNSSLVIICLYVDDLLVTRNDSTEIERFKVLMKSEFDMTDLGKLTYFLGIEFITTEERIMMQQKKYTDDVLKWFNMANYNLAATPTKTNPKWESNYEGEAVDSTLLKQIVGSLRYLYDNISDI